MWQNGLKDNSSIGDLTAMTFTFTTTVVRQSCFCMKSYAWKQELDRWLNNVDVTLPAVGTCSRADSGNHHAERMINAKDLKSEIWINLTPYICLLYCKYLRPPYLLGSICLIPRKLKLQPTSWWQLSPSVSGTHRFQRWWIFRLMSWWWHSWYFPTVFNPKPSHSLNLGTAKNHRTNMNESSNPSIPQ